MENLLFIVLIAGVAAIAVVAARRPGRPAIRRRYDYDVGPGTEPRGDGGPTAGADYERSGGDHGGGYGGDSGGGGYGGGGDGGGGGGGS